MESFIKILGAATLALLIMLFPFLLAYSIVNNWDSSFIFLLVIVCILEFIFLGSHYTNIVDGDYIKKKGGGHL